MLLLIVAAISIIRHDGIVIAEGAAERALQGARVGAYAAEQALPSGPCVLPGGDMAHASTGAAGTYTLRIDASATRYYSVICAEGYAPRAEWVANDRRIRGTTVRLWRTTLPAAAAIGAAERALASVLDEAGTALRAIRSMDPTAHLVAKEGARPEDVALIELLDARAVTRASSDPAPDRASPAAVRELLDTAAGHARYFWRVAPAAFDAAAGRLPPPDQAAVVWLRNRPRGTGN